MKYLVSFLVFTFLASCATNPKGFQKQFNLTSGNEVRPAHPFHTGKSDCLIINQTNAPIQVQTGNTDTIIWSKSHLTFEVNAKDSIIIDDVLIDYELLGKQKYKWVIGD